MTDVPYRDREFNTGVSYTTLNKYIKSVYPHHVRDHAREIVENIEPGYKRYCYAAALARHVYQEIEYSSDHQLWRADYILDHTKQGDCEDQTVCLASLLVARNFKIRFVSLIEDGKNIGHLILQVNFSEDTKISDLIDEAKSTYTGNLVRLGWDKNEEGYWLTCDPTGSPIVGYIGSYFDVHRTGKVRWKDNVTKDVLYWDDI